MNQFTNEELLDLVQKATSGDKKSLESIVLGVQDLVFNLSLRMLGTFHDAEDATQDILLKAITHLSSFKGESSFSTWVFSIATNHLKNYQKHMFAKFPLSFEFYGDDIKNAKIGDVPDLTQNVEQSILAEELKLSCTNVMLQCLDAESRCIFILGTMFKLDSRIAGDILGITPEAYRQRLSRIRKKVADFLKLAKDPTKTQDTGILLRIMQMTSMPRAVRNGRSLQMKNARVFLILRRRKCCQTEL